ncbi:hypothetical protein O9929_16250 [Vibrio lentus]|nr:hypothetical protein [Vibrio lentus]
MKPDDSGSNVTISLLPFPYWLNSKIIVMRFVGAHVKISITLAGLKHDLQSKPQMRGVLRVHRRRNNCSLYVFAVQHHTLVCCKHYGQSVGFVGSVGSADLSVRWFT